MILIFLLLLKVLSEALPLGNRAVFVLKKDLLQLNNFISHLVDLRGQGIVFAAEDLDLRLQVRKPLLLALSALQGGNAAIDQLCFSNFP